MYSIVIAILEKEKMVYRKDRRVYLDEFCTEQSYESQKIKNERRYKTLVTLYGIDEEGDRRIIHRLFLPFHQRIDYARTEFFKIYPLFCENEEFILTVQYTDSLRRSVETVYETKGY